MAEEERPRTGLSPAGWARHSRCTKCEHWCARPVWKWPHCTHGPAELEITRELLDGPEGNCPAGYWNGLVPVDLEKVEAGRETSLDETQRKTLAPILRAALRVSGATDGKREEILVEAVKAGLRIKVAMELAEEAGLKLDAKP